jgi:hypothetical protein
MQRRRVHRPSVHVPAIRPKSTAVTVFGEPLNCSVPSEVSIAGSVKVFAKRDNAMSASTPHEIGIVHYPGAQVACILGLTDLFGVASAIAVDQRRSGRSPLRVTHWQPLHSRDANLSCFYDSAPRGSPKPRILIIPPTMVDLPDPDVPGGVQPEGCGSSKGRVLCDVPPVPQCARVSSVPTRPAARTGRPVGHGRDLHLCRWAKRHSSALIQHRLPRSSFL